MSGKKQCGFSEPEILEKTMFVARYTLFIEEKES